MRTIRPSTWAKAERLYFEGEFSIAEIASQCEINRNTLYLRAQKFNWPPHASLRLEGAVSERAVLRRIIVAKLKQLETRMEDPEAKPTDDERSTRAFASLLTTFDKLDAKEAAWREKVMPGSTDTPAGTTTSPYGDDNVADWRQELADRIASLGARRHQ